MFQDLVQRAKNHGHDVKLERERKDEVRNLIRETVESFIPEIKELGFVDVKYYNSTPTYFSLRIQPRRGYSEDRFTHNMELGSITNTINYGSGANSAQGKQMEFSYDMNNSQIVGITKNALRALVSGALQSMEHIKAQGWN